MTVSMATGKGGRSKDRKIMTVSLPVELKAKIRALADKDPEFPGDMTRWFIETCAKLGMKEAKEFLRSNTTYKHSAKKRKKS
jgi:hypothetical protein